MTYRGVIEGFHGSWGSGLGTLIVSGRPVHCDNGPTVRALEGAFGNVIGPDHCVNNSTERRRDASGRFLPRAGHIGREIVYTVDHFGLLCSFTPVEDWQGPEIPEDGISDEELEALL